RLGSGYGAPRCRVAAPPRSVLAHVVPLHGRRYSSGPPRLGQPRTIPARHRMGGCQPDDAEKLRLDGSATARPPGPGLRMVEPTPAGNPHRQNGPAFLHPGLTHAELEPSRPAAVLIPPGTIDDAVRAN